MMTSDFLTQFREQRDRIEQDRLEIRNRLQAALDDIDAHRFSFGALDREAHDALGLNRRAS